jgi:4-amino-4-deoxy-L-arabinose transferase-like glycosyltransferase
VDQPLLYAHPYNYFNNALAISQHAHPLEYVLRHDEWRMQYGDWTVAPLYYLFAAAVFAVFGPHLFPLQLLQCFLGSLAAVAVAAMAREMAGRRGHWAGVAYALYWPAIECVSQTLTENLHTPLLTLGLAALVRSASRESLAGTRLGGLLVGLSALARSVSSAFLVLTALWHCGTAGLRRGWKPALLVLASGLAVILPWSARNVVLVGDAVPIESFAYENLWFANALVSREQFQRQEQVVYAQATPAERRSAASHFALRGIRRNPRGFVEKVRANFWHFFRPEGLHALFVEQSEEAWRSWVRVILDDGLLFLTLPLLGAALFAGGKPRGQSLLWLWLGYYLFCVIVVFHVEVRYRSAFMPFAVALGAAGATVLARRDRVALLGALVGVALAVASLRPYVPSALDTLRAAGDLRPAAAAVARGDMAGAEKALTAAAGENPRSARPWLSMGRVLWSAGRIHEAEVSYERAAFLSSPANWTARLALPRLLAQVGETRAAVAALEVADDISWDNDPWLALEVAWRTTPPPTTAEVRVGDNDYGAVRGFYHPRGGDPRRLRRLLGWNRYNRPGEEAPPPGKHRWTRDRAWLRLVPAQAGASDVILVMGSPFPSTLASPTVRVRIDGREAGRVTLSRELRPYRFQATARPGEAMVVRLDSPTWCRIGEPADQGVRVDSLTVRPAEGPATAR